MNLHLSISLSRTLFTCSKVYFYKMNCYTTKLIYFLPLWILSLVIKKREESFYRQNNTVVSFSLPVCLLADSVTLSLYHSYLSPFFLFLFFCCCISTAANLFRCSWRRIRIYVVRKGNVDGKFLTLFMRET